MLLSSRSFLAGGTCSVTFSRRDPKDVHANTHATLCTDVDVDEIAVSVNQCQEHNTEKAFTVKVV